MTRVTRRRIRLSSMQPLSSCLRRESHRFDFAAAEDNPRALPTGAEAAESAEHHVPPWRRWKAIVALAWRCLRYALAAYLAVVLAACFSRIRCRESWPTHGRHGPGWQAAPASASRTWRCWANRWGARWPWNWPLETGPAGWCWRTRWPNWRPRPPRCSPGCRSASCSAPASIRPRRSPAITAPCCKATAMPIGCDPERYHEIPKERNFERKAVRPRARPGARRRPLARIMPSFEFS